MPELIAGQLPVGGEVRPTPIIQRAEDILMSINNLVNEAVVRQESFNSNMLGEMPLASPVEQENEPCGQANLLIARLVRLESRVEDLLASQFHMNLII